MTTTTTPSAQIDSIDTAQRDVEVLNALKSGSRALDRLQSQWPIEEVESLLEDTAEALQRQQEIDSLLCEFGAADEGAVDDELDSLEREAARRLEQLLPDVRSTPALPQVDDAVAVSAPHDNASATTTTTAAAAAAAATIDSDRSDASSSRSAQLLTS